MTTKKNQAKDIFPVKTKLVDIHEGGGLTVLLNEREARKYGINSRDKVSLLYEGKEIVLDADLTNKLINPGQVGILRDVSEKYRIKNDELVALSFTQRSSASIEALKKGLQGKRLTQKENFAIMKAIAENRFTDIMTTYYSAMGFFYPSTDLELYWMAKAMAETGETLHFKGIAADKHCMGGVPGNETTMIIIPLLASLGIQMPKTFSKAITTPAATGECVSVLMDISFTKPEIEKLVKKNNSCLVRGGGLDLAPADEKLIKVAYPLSMQSYSRTIVSIVAKKHAMGITHSLIDIPVGPSAKVPDMKTAKKLKQKFLYVAKKLGMKMYVALTEAKEPIGAGVGGVLQVREVLRVLQQHKLRPKDLEEKSIHLCAKVIEMVGMAKGKKAEEIAREELKSGRARKKMQKIIKAENGNPNIKSESLKLAKIKEEVKSTRAGKIRNMDLKAINAAARTLGAPLDLQAGLFFDKKTGDVVKKGDVIFTLYANEKSKIKMAKESIANRKMYEIK